ncbi:hypothetical protein BGZ83_004210 [Gryganskiella cystojenkinii]|nr:hypothetical protein BGZ83_004210 [Gryganskiella cystojenkinii]
MVISENAIFLQPDHVPAHTPARALEIPEILQQVFSELDQVILRTTTRLVSRSWYLCSEVFIIREAVWTENVRGLPFSARSQDDRDLQTWITGLSQSSALRLESSTDVSPLRSLPAKEQDRIWDDLGAAILASQLDRTKQHMPTPSDDPQDTRGNSSQLPQQNLKELTFHRIENTMVRLGDMIPYLPCSTLTTLRLEFIPGPATIRLDYILDHLCNLERFYLGNLKKVYRPNDYYPRPENPSCTVVILPMMHPWVKNPRHNTVDNNGDSDNHDDNVNMAWSARASSLTPTRLKVFSLNEVRIGSEIIEDLLMRSPRLEVLELLLIAPIPKPYPRSSVPVPPDVADSYRETFELRDPSSATIREAQRTKYRAEIVKILTRCHSLGLGKTLKKLGIVVSGRELDDSLMADLVQLYTCRPKNIQDHDHDFDNDVGDICDSEDTFRGGQVTSWGLYPTHMAPILKRLSMRAGRMYLSSLEQPLETAEEEENRVGREGPRLLPRSQFQLGSHGPPQDATLLSTLSPSFDFLLLRTTIPNNVTTLDLCWDLKVAPSAFGEILHCYLCHAPHLRHLLASSVTIGLDNFDIFEHFFQPAVTQSMRKRGWTEENIHLDRTSKYFWLEKFPRDPIRAQVQFPQDYSPSLQRKRIWACRNLETLQIHILVRGVVPRLKVLEIMCDSFTNLELESGLCVLGSSMKQLERLVLRKNAYWVNASLGQDRIMHWMQRHQWSQPLPLPQDHWDGQVLQPVAVKRWTRSEKGETQDVLSVHEGHVRNRILELERLLVTLPPLSRPSQSTVISVEEALWENGHMSQVHRSLAEMELEDLKHLLVLIGLRHDAKQENTKSEKENEIHLIEVSSLECRRWPRLQWINLVSFLDVHPPTDIIRRRAGCPNKRDPIGRFYRRDGIDV